MIVVLESLSSADDEQAELFKLGDGNSDGGGVVDDDDS